jgi:thioredoxin-like negative regulator of GroEL
VRVDLGAYPHLAQRFKIRALPTLLLFRAGVLIDFIV